MKNNSQSCALFLAQKFLAPRPTELPSVWAEKNFIFNEEEIRGRFNFEGRNYLRKPIDDNNDPNVREQTIVSGTGVGKTITFIVGICWKILFKPCRGIVVWPAQKGEGSSSNFTSTRLIPDIEATPALNDLIPKTGQKRFKLNKQFIRIGGAHFGFVGGNSAGQVAGNRCGDVRMDETDKFPTSLKNEAGTGTLVRNRTEGVTDWQIFDTSTPTIEGAIIWPRLQRSSLFLYFVPCPHCNGGKRRRGAKEREFEARQKKFKGWMVYAWNEQFAAGLPMKVGTINVPFCFVKWDKKAKGRDGIWNYHKVQETAHFECPHCQEKIFDFKDGQIFPDIKNWMDENGIWILAKPGVPKHVGYHVSSLYAPVINEESTVGGRAVKFLSAHAEGDLRDFINSTLALPEVGQNEGLNTIQMNSKPLAQDDWVSMLTADFHKNFPYIWFSVRKWCAFKLLPSFEVSELKTFIEGSGDEGAIKRANSLINGFDEAWKVLAELMRFDSRTGVSPVIDFLLAQKITGRKLIKMFQESGERTIEFRTAIYKEMGIKKPPRGGDSELIAVGHCSLSGDYVWDEIKELIQEFKVGQGMSIPGHCVGIDTGYAEKFNREVLRKCFESATQFKYYDPMSRNRPAIFYEKPIHNMCQSSPLDGWHGMRGYPMTKRWNHGGITNELNVNVEDPFFGTPEAGKSVVEVVEFPSGLFWLRKDDLRKQRTKLSYNVSPEVKFYPEHSLKLADYEKHMNELFYDTKKGIVRPRRGEGGSQSRNHPYHLDDCENMQIALATHHEFFEVEEKKK